MVIRFDPRRMFLLCFVCMTIHAAASSPDLSPLSPAPAPEQPAAKADFLTAHRWGVFSGAAAVIVLQAGLIVFLLYRFRRRTGKETHPLQASRPPVKAGAGREWFGMIQNVIGNFGTECQYNDNLLLLLSIMDTLPCYIFVKNADDGFRYLLANSRFCEVIGQDSSFVPGKFDRDIFPLDPSATEKFRADDEALLASGGSLSEREFFLNSNGEKIVTHTFKDILTQSDGTRLLVGMGIDISEQYKLEQEQKKTIEALNRFARNERIINQSLTRITLEPDFDRAVNEMLRIIGENAGADRSYIFHYTADDLTRADNIYEWVRDGVKPEREHLRDVDMTQFPAWSHALENRQDITIPDMDHPPAEFEFVAIGFRKQQIRSLLACGIWLDNRLYGYVGLDFVQEKHLFDDSDIQMVHSISNLFLLARERTMQLNRVADSVSLQRQIVDNLTISLMIIAPDYKVVTANPKAASDCGRSVEHMLGLNCYDLVCCNPGGPPDWCPLQKTLADQNMHHCETEVLGHCESIITRPLFDRHGKLIYVLKSSIDMTDFNRQKTELQKAMEKAQAADRAKSAFLATMSHELRTPLNAVIGFSELLRQGNIQPAEQDEYLRSINLAGSALLNLINDVLDLSKLEADQMTINYARVDVASLLDEMALVFKLKAREKNLTLTVDSSQARGLLYVDELRLRQILLNLVGNAVKFTHAGGVRVYAEFKLDPNESEGTLEIKVSDSGIGISAEHIRMIFDPFVQDNSTRGQRAYEGTGLGLAISKRLIQKMGGDIRVVSKPGSGSTFIVRINKVRYEKEFVLPDSSREDSSVGRVEQSCRILLVDDVMLNLKVLSAMLKKLGVESVSAISGKEALQFLRKREHFDLILTDLWMPDMNGAELAGILHRDPRFSSIPIIAVTADSQVVAGVEDAFNGILLKPITLDSLRHTLRPYVSFANTEPA